MRSDEIRAVRDELKSITLLSIDAFRNAIKKGFWVH